MKKTSSRSRKIGDQIQRELAELFREHVKDPRIGFITITGVEVTNDNAHANVYFTHMDSVKTAKDAEESLARASGFLRSEIGHRLNTYTVPQLHFIYDSSIEHGMEMSALIDKAIASDKNLPE
jgi:ribosome-binding factor A